MIESEVRAGSITYDDEGDLEVDVFARELPDGPVWSFYVNEGDSTPDWWRVP